VGVKQDRELTDGDGNPGQRSGRIPELNIIIVGDEQARVIVTKSKESRGWYRKYAEHTSNLGCRDNNEGPCHKVLPQSHSPHHHVQPAKKTILKIPAWPVLETTADYE
jgi:hypothetical protein